MDQAGAGDITADNATLNKKDSYTTALIAYNHAMKLMAEKSRKTHTQYILGELDDVDFIRLTKIIRIEDFSLRVNLRRIGRNLDCSFTNLEWLLSNPY